MKITHKSDPALELASRIYSFKEEGESWTDAVDRYARDVLFRHPRTVHRWLSGESPLPLAVIVMLSDGVRFSYTPESPEVSP